MVMIVNKDGSYAPRPVVVSGQQGNNWIITGGLNQGDKVIIDGMAIVQMTGAKQVQTKPWGVDMPPAGMPPQGQAGQGGQAGQPENNPQEQEQPENSSEQAQQGQPETENNSEKANQSQPEQSENTEQPKA